MVSIKRPPDTLRMQVQLSGHGKDVKDALAKLKSRRDAVKAKLVELGANKETVEVGEARAAVEDSSRRRQMEMMVQQRMRQQGRRAPKKEETKPVSLSVEVKAEWALKGQNAEQLLIAAYDIQQKVTPELAKLNVAEEMSPEELELAEEMGQNMGMDDGQPKPGEPSFVYVARISGDELAKALASAYDKAKTQATQLSQAAGATLGPLEQLASHESMVDMENPFNGNSYRSNPYFYRAMVQQQQQPFKDSGGPTEAVGIDPSQVAVSITIVASFGLKE